MGGMSIRVRDKFSAGASVALGLVNHRQGLVTTVDKFGRNTAVGNSAFEIISASGVLNFLELAATVRIKAGGDAADTAAGVGAREVTVQGIAVVGGNLRIATEAIATAGASASAATTLTWWRIWRAWVSSAGAYGGKNTAAITIEDTDGPDDQIVIPLDSGQTATSLFSTPDDRQLLIEQFILSIDTTQSAELRLCVRENFNDVTVPFSPTRIKRTFGAFAGMENHPNSSPIVIPPLSDVWIEGKAAAASALISTMMLGKLVAT